MGKDYYAILGVSRNATQEEIKRAYRKKAIQYHPDRNPGDKEAEEKFKEAAEAYEILGDPEKRARYDQFGSAAFEGPGAGGQYHHFDDLEDIFRHFGDIFGDFFGGGFGDFGGRTGQRGYGSNSRVRQIKGRDLRIRLKIDLNDIIHGGERKIKVRRKVVAPGTRYQTCPSCNGAGEVRHITHTIFGTAQTTSVCRTCGGTGQVTVSKPHNADNEGLVWREDIVTVKIPKGIREGVQLKVAQKGNEAPSPYGVPGDLLVEFKEEIPDEYTIKGIDLYKELDLSLPEAVLGTTKVVDTPHGKIKLHLENGVESGKILRIRGKGIPDLNTDRYGDLYIRIHVQMPKKLSDEDRAYFEKKLQDKNFQTVKRKKKSFFERIQDIFS